MQWLYLDANGQQVAAEEEQLGALVQQGIIQGGTMMWNETMTDWHPAQAIWPDTFAAAPATPTVQRPQGAGPPVIKRRGSKRPAGRPGRPSAKTKPAAGSHAGSRTSRLRRDEEEDEINAATRRFGGILRKYNGWIIFVAIMLIIYGAINILSGAATFVASPHPIAFLPIAVGAIPIVLATFLIKGAGSAKLAAETGFPENLDKSLTHYGNYFLGIAILLLIMLLIIGGVIAIFLSAPAFLNLEDFGLGGGSAG